MCLFTALNIAPATAQATLTLAPTADAYVQDGTAAATNFGTAAILLAKKTTSTYNRYSYLKFDLSSAAGATVTSATLRLYGANLGTGYTGSDTTSSVADTTWTETGLTWNNKPALGGALASASISSTAAYVTWDVTASVQSQLAAGKSLSSFAVTMNAVSANNQADSFNSKEASSNPPQLVLTLAPPALASLSLTPTSGFGGSATATGTVTLTSPATASTTVTLASSDQVHLAVPASVIVNAGSTSATFTATSHTVTAPTTVTVTATYSGISKTATFTANPTAVSSVSFSPASVTGGAASTGTVHMTGAVGSAQTITLTSSNPSALSVPASVSLLYGTTSVTFPATSHPVATSAAVTVTASYNGGSQTGTITVLAPALSSVSVSPTSVTGGSANATGTVTLSGAAPTGGVSVSLSSSSPSATVPTSVPVLAGSSSATFPVTTTSVTTATTATLTATYSGVSKTTVLTVNPAASTGLRIDAGASATYTDTKGYIWSADQDFTGGATTSTASAITGTDPKLYQTQRAGTSFTYTLPAPNGNYLLSLLFAEIEGKTTGQRTFTVKAGSQTLLSNFDIYAAAGANIALLKTFTVPVTNGQLTLTFTGNTSSATVAAIEISPIPTHGGILYGAPGSNVPLPDIPAPGWAEGALASDDSSDADGMGPSMGGPVCLPSGVEENSPGADLWAYNSLGPGAAYSRMYRSARAMLGYASPGLSPGWTDSYDLFVAYNGSSYTLTYDNGGQEVWSGTTGSLTTPPGAPYLVAQTPANGSIPAFLTMTAKDRTKYTFTQVSAAGGNYAAGTYLLTKITNLVGHSITLNRDTPFNGYRVTTVANDATPPTVLLTLAYNSGTGLLSTVTDAYSRKIVYGFTGSNLAAVSQISDVSNATPLTRWGYGYTPSPTNNRPLLIAVQAPDPSNPGQLDSSYTVYYDTGAVANHQDAVGRVKTYTYNVGNVGNVGIQVNNADGSPAEAWTQKDQTGGKNQDIGTIDANKKATAIGYGGNGSPYLPSLLTNRNTQATTVTYDGANAYGNVATVTDNAGLQTATTYLYSSDFVLGQPGMVQTSHVNAGGTADDTQQPTTFAYYGPTDVPTDGGPAGTIDGLLKAVASPLPDTTTANSGAPVTTTYTYDRLGNVIQMQTPNANGTMTVAYNYTAYSYVDSQSVTHTYSKTEAVGEPVSVTTSGPDYTGATTTTVSYARYDPRGNSTATIDALGNETDYSYNLADQMVQVSFPPTGDSGSGQAHSISTYQYPGGSLSSEAMYDEGNHTTPFRQVNYTYDPEGEVTFLSGDTYPVSYGYDGRGRVVSVTYYQSSVMDSHTTYYDYDDVGNLADVRYPGQTGATFDKLQYFYDADNNLSEEIDGIGVEKDYQRFDPTTKLADPVSLLRTLHYVYPTGYAGTKITDVGYTYDHYQRRLSMTDGTGSKAYAYDDLDELTGTTINLNAGLYDVSPPLQGLQITYSHNADGSRSLRGLPDFGYDQAYLYDGLGRLQLTYLPNVGEGSYYTYLKNGWLTQRQALYYSSTYSGYVPFLQADQTYNTRGFLKTLTNSLINDPTKPTQLAPLADYRAMAYDPDGNRLGETSVIPARGSGMALSRTVQYAYDNLDELTSEVSTPAPGAYNAAYSENSVFDLSGNPTSFLGLRSSTFNSDNQDSSNSYNGNGDPLAFSILSSGPYTAKFDPEDRLTALPALYNFAAAYDGDGLRAWNYPTPVVPTVYYLYDGDTPLLEIDSNTNLLAYTLRGATGVEARDDSQAYVGYESYAFDPQGSLAAPVGLLTTNGPVTPRVPVLEQFDAYGYYGYQNADDPHGLSYYYPIRYGGQYGYYQDDTLLYQLGHRYYNFTNGRFLTRDPIGYQGGINLYGFVGNNPVNQSDPSGTQNQTNQYPGLPPPDDSTNSNPYIEYTKTGELNEQPSVAEVLSGQVHSSQAAKAVVKTLRTTKVPRPSTPLVGAGRWMSTEEFEKMLDTDRIQPSTGAGYWKGFPMDASQGTVPANPNTFKNYKPGSVFAQFDIPSDLFVQGMNSESAIFFGPNNIHGQLYIKRGGKLDGMPRVSNLRITAQDPRKK